VPARADGAAFLWSLMLSRHACGQFYVQHATNSPARLSRLELRFVTDIQA
jgi:hypothetical protein